MKRKFELTVDALLLCVSLFWLVAANGLFFQSALNGRDWGVPSTWGFALALAVMLMGLHSFLLGLVLNRWTVKPVLIVLIVGTALATYYMKSFGVYLDPSMMRNVIKTDPAESKELLSWALLMHLLLYAGIPLLLLWRVKVIRLPWRRAILRRLGLLVVSLAAAVLSIYAVFQPFSSLMRNHKEIRYLITPANYIWSLAKVIAQETKGAAKPKEIIGQDAKPGPSWAVAGKPKLLVLVVGETARAANWGLNGYARPTTPQLAQLPVINFNSVTSCGTNTETSLPCMFAPVGRRDYDEDKIRGSQSLLNVVARAGVQVQWRDNQSGCKGVCDGLPTESVTAQDAPGFCNGERCLDEGLLSTLDRHLTQAKGTQLLVLHQLGNHGPSYYKRYPPEFETFKPACRQDDLRLCQQSEIVNAYDNALVYTDHVLATLIKRLQAQADQVDSAVLYVSDHGESLGENGLYLHGIPYSIAPDVQNHVPMIFWASEGYQKATGLSMSCLKAVAQQPTSHDSLFHTLLGLLDVQTPSLYEKEWDWSAGCRRHE